MQAEAIFPQQTYACWTYAGLVSLSAGYPPLQGRLPTRYSPVRRFTRPPKETFSLDLHVLGTPPAFILSRDQTLMFNLAMRLHAVFAFHYSVFKDLCAVVQLYSIDTFFIRLSTEKNHKRTYCCVADCLTNNLPSSCQGVFASFFNPLPTPLLPCKSLPLVCENRCPVKGAIHKK